MTARAALLVLLLAGCHTSDIDPMEIQPKLRPYTESDFFEDGRAMRAPPPGTVPRERPMGDPVLTGGLVDGRDADRIPLPITRELLERGQKRFEITCSACHGVLGDGRSLVARNMALRPPPSLHARRLQDAPPGAIFRVISQGYGLMPALAAEIPPEERWAAIAYLRALQLSQSAPVALAPPEVRARLGVEK